MASASDTQCEKGDDGGSRPKLGNQQQGSQQARQRPPREYSRTNDNFGRYPPDYYYGHGGSNQGFYDGYGWSGGEEGTLYYSHYPNYSPVQEASYYQPNRGAHGRGNVQRSRGRKQVAHTEVMEQSNWMWEDSRRDQRGRGRRGGGRGGGRGGWKQNYTDQFDVPPHQIHDDYYGNRPNRGGREGMGRGRGGGSGQVNASHHRNRSQYDLDYDKPRDQENNDAAKAGDIVKPTSQRRKEKQTDKSGGQNIDEGDSRSRSGSGSSKKDEGSNRTKGSSGIRNQSGAGKKHSKKIYSETQTGSLIEHLTAGTYECPVCCDRIHCEAKVWSCKTCYVVFHMGCIKKWAKSPAAIAEGADGWQCPACRSIEVKIPHVYMCFCGKLRDPPWEPGETPHSCGEVCRRKRPTSCPHLCNILCHPGPCPPCPANVQQHCLCGKSHQTVRCGTQNEIRCQKQCEKLLDCHRHRCQKVCHTGQCSPCGELVVQECYCGQATREVACTKDSAFADGSGKFSCMTSCGKPLDCGHHRCVDPCHQGPCKPCSLDPVHITHCPCGRTPLSLLVPVERKVCTDPVPTCDKTCNKELSCGGKEPHRCERACHTGPCPACDQMSMIKCRCGHRYVDLPCLEIAESVKREGGMAPPLCDRKCTKKKHCGRHKCGQLCCVDPDHLCFQLCGRKLKCGIHACEEPCHIGNCPPCLYASFEELTCHCGTEVLLPPVACGTPPPECHQPCNRRHDCEHPIRHHCHPEEKCPPCVELIRKTCIGGHEVRYNIPCHVQRISCGRPCGKPLPCGYHNCLKTCHPGDCDPECKQPCKVPRSDCGHTCHVTCHVGWPCPQITCKAKVTVKCPCGRRGQVMECQASGSDGINQTLQRLTISKLAGKIQTLQQNEEVDISELTGAKGSSKASRLLCDEECGIEERNRRLAVALQIRNPDVSSNAKTTNYSDFLKEQARKHQGFVAAIEKELAALVVSAQGSKQPSRSHPFPSMIRNHRRIIHELAEFYGCESESYDDEPKRNVVTTARKNRCFMPTITLTSMIQREIHPRGPIPIPHASHELEIRSATKAVKLSTDVMGSMTTKEKVIDYFDMTD